MSIYLYNSEIYYIFALLILKHMNDKNLILTELNRILVSPEKNGEISEKQKNAIEKLQLEFLKLCVIELSNEYRDKGVSFDLEILNDIRREKNQWIIKDDGTIIPRKDSNKNVWYDSKSFDAIIPISIKDKNFTLFFILKGTQNDGGHQGDVKVEIGRYSKQIQKNKDEFYHFIFQLDGAFLNKDIDSLDIFEKYDVSTTENIKNTIENFINKNLF